MSVSRSIDTTPARTTAWSSATSRRIGIANSWLYGRSKDRQRDEHTLSGSPTTLPRFAHEVNSYDKSAATSQGQHKLDLLTNNPGNRVCFDDRSITAM